MRCLLHHTYHPFRTCISNEQSAALRDLARERSIMSEHRFLETEMNLYRKVDSIDGIVYGKRVLLPAAAATIHCCEVWTVIDQWSDRVAHEGT